MSNYFESRLKYEQTFRCYYRALVIYAESILSNREDAEDVVQEFFMKLWDSGKLMGLDPVTEKSYMYVSIRNGCLNRLKSNITKSNKNIRIDNMIEIESSQKLEQEIIDIEELRLAYLAIEQLPPTCREIFKRICIDGKKYEEVASELGLSLNTIKVQMFRAYKKLRQFMVVIFFLIIYHFFHTNL